MGHAEVCAAAVGLASLALVPLSMCVIAINAQLELSLYLWCGKHGLTYTLG